MNNTYSFTNWALLFALVIIWGASFVAIKIAITDITPAWLAASRILLATILMIGFARLTNIRAPSGRAEWGVALVLGVIGTTLPFALIGWASIFVPSGIAGLMMATNPMLVLLLAIFVLPDEPPTKTRIVGLLVGFLGVAMVIMGRAAPQVSLPISNTLTTPGFDWTLLAYLALLLGALGYAINNVASRRAANMPHATRGYGALLTAAPSAIILAALSEPFPDFFAMHINTLGAIFYLGVLPTWIATLILYRLIAHTSAGFVAQSNYLVPATAILLGAWLLGEQLAPIQYLGFGIILLGIGIAENLLKFTPKR
ncbi:MAG: EamA family transporter [Devosiaceae bacterium]|nr:EamA family transporter [Devosiaceae bacterium]